MPIVLYSILCCSVGYSRGGVTLGASFFRWVGPTGANDLRVPLSALSFRVSCLFLRYETAMEDGQLSYAAAPSKLPGEIFFRREVQSHSGGWGKAGSEKEGTPLTAIIGDR